jgi:hypothetical protein
MTMEPSPVHHLESFRLPLGAGPVAGKHLRGAPAVQFHQVALGAAALQQLADTACGGREVRVDLQVRRFLCGGGGCARKTFAEQVPGLTVRYGRRTFQLRGVLEAVALALAGRAGARLTRRLACAVSRSTLLRLIRAAADPDDQTPLILGVDDFAAGRPAGGGRGSAGTGPGCGRPRSRSARSAPGPPCPGP